MYVYIYMYIYTHVYRNTCVHIHAITRQAPKDARHLLSRACRLHEAREHIAHGVNGL